MAKSKDFQGEMVGPSYRGRFYSYHQGHQTIHASWPTYMPNPKTAAQQWTRAKFKAACWLMKSIPPEIQTLYRESVKGTPFLPRDALLASVYGKGPMIILPDGTRIPNMATKVNMSEVLDNIAWIPGSVLYRDDWIWKGLPNPEEEAVLRFDPVAQRPFWGASGGGSEGAGVSFFTYEGPTQNTTAGNLCGVTIQCEFATSLGKVWFWASYPSGATIRPYLLRINSGGTVLEIVRQLDDQVAAGSGNRQLSIDFEYKDILNANSRYFIGCSLPAQGTTYANPWRLATAADNKNLPINGIIARCVLSKIDPILGDTFSVSGSVRLQVAGEMSII